MLTLEELDRLCSAFVARGVRKLRLTGGEPLVRRGIMTLVALAVAPPAQRRARRADADHQRLAARQIRRRARGRGVRRINVSLDTLDAEKFRAITRWGELDRCSPASTPRRPPASRSRSTPSRCKGVNEDEFPRLIEWAHGRGMDLTLIEVMPLGEIGEGRLDQYLPLSTGARAPRASATRSTSSTIAPAARRATSASRETGGRLGFITPLTHNFCESCNRVRVTCTGTLYMCLGQEDAADLRKPLRASEGNDLAARRDRRSDRAQAEGPRFHHRSAPPAAGAGAPYERDRRIALVVMRQAYPDAFLVGRRLLPDL